MIAVECAPNCVQGKGHTAMLYEQRVYEAMPGRMPALNKRFAEVTLGLFARHGIEVVGFWTNEVGGHSNELVYMLRFQDMADREARWGAFQRDPEWQQKRAASEVDGPLVARLTNALMRPTPYSPMQ
jgi:hypothetical protein